jgi:hypothetical protein
MAGTNVTLPQAGDEVTATWGQDVAKGLNGIQSGIVAVATTATVAVDTTVTFPKPYAVAPAVVLTPVGGNTVLAGHVSAVSATTFAFRVFKRDGSALAVGTTQVHWIAAGTLA